jgi:TolB-like protein
MMSRGAVSAMIGFVAGAACACSAPAVAQERPTLALLPFENVSGSVAGARIVMPLVERALTERGYRVLGPEPLEPFLTRRRIRNTGQLSRTHLGELGREHGATVALVGAVAIFNDSPENPQWGLSARLLDADSGTILWAGSAGLTGDDFTIALGLGAIRAPERLAAETVKAVLRDLPRAGERVGALSERTGLLPSFFGVKAAYRSQALDSSPPKRIAVLPFENLSERKGAGRIVTDIATTVLARRGRFEVVEPGTVAEALLAIGAAPYGNMDFDTLGALRRRLEADALILGTVWGYSEGLKKAATTAPDIALDARMLDMETGRILWVADGARNGEDSRIAMHFGSIRAMVPLVERVLRDMLGTL